MRKPKKWAALLKGRKRASGAVDVYTPESIIHAPKAKWIWEGLIIQSATNIISSLPKCGKTTLINLIAVTVALVPPDDNHRFGHDKFQDLAIFSQSIFFFISCLSISDTAKFVDL